MITKSKIKTKIELSYRYIRAHKFLFIVCCLVGITLISLLAIFSNLISRPFDSDDVAEQTMAHGMFLSGPHAFKMEIDTFMIKYPFYIILNGLMHPSVAQLIIEVVLFNLIMVGLLYLWWKKFAPNKSITWLVFVWLISSGTFWMAETINPNTRNFETPVMLLFVFVTLRWFENFKGKIIKDKKSFVAKSAALGILAGVLIYNDPYLLFYVLFPLGLVVLIDAKLKKRSGPLFSTFLIFVFGIIVFNYAWVLGTHHGFGLTKFNEITDVSSSITTLHYLPHKVFNVIQAFLSLFGIITTQNFWQFLRGIFGLSLIGLAIFEFFRTIIKRNFSITNLWIICTFVFTFLYVSMTGLAIVNTFRYLIILVPLTALLAARGLLVVKKRGGRLYSATIIVISLSLLINVVVAAQHIYSKGPHTMFDQTNARLATVLKDNDIKVSYGNYWVADMTYYLSNYKDNVLPTDCYSGIVYKDPSLLDVNRFNAKSKYEGVIVSPDLVIPTNSIYRQTPSCDVETTIKQFGKPVKVIAVTPTVHVVVYDHPLKLSWRKY